MIRIAVLISGRGSNMSCLAKAIKNYDIAAKIVIVISNKDVAKGLPLREITMAFQPRLLSEKTFIAKPIKRPPLRQPFIIKESDYVFLAGYMSVLGSDFVNRFAGKLINIHPSLLPAFRGLNTHQRAIDKNAELHGVSVHLVTAKLDDGPMIASSKAAHSRHRYRR